MTSDSLNERSISWISEIKNLAENKRFSEMSESVKKFTELLYINQFLLYSEVSKEFEESGLINTLVSILPSNDLSVQSKRDLLRLINLFTKTNKNIKRHLVNDTSFVEMLSRTLSKKEIWNNTEKYKYHIYIASHVLTYNDVICRTVRERLSIPQSSLLLKVFYACLNHSGSFEEILENLEDSNCHNFVIKNEIGVLIDIIRDYIVDFQTFYTSKNEYNQGHMYRLKSEFTFEQICRTVCYYGRQSKEFRMNIYQSGFYDSITSVFLIQNIPEDFLLFSLNTLKLIFFDPKIRSDFEKANNFILLRLAKVNEMDHLSPDTKFQVRCLLDKFTITDSSYVSDMSELSQFSHQSIPTKAEIGTFIDTIRDYIVDFQSFYSSKSDYRPRDLCHLNSDSTFEQICKKVCHYGKISTEFRMNLYQSGFYDPITRVFLIQNIPEEYLLFSLDTLRLILLDPKIKEDFEKTNYFILQRLTKINAMDYLSYETKIEVRSLVDKFTITDSRYTTDPLTSVLVSTSTGMDTSRDKSMFPNIRMWGSLDVDQWLADNNLDIVRMKLIGLTGKGLIELKLFISTESGRLKLLDVLLGMEMPLAHILELFGCLKELEI